MGSPVALIALIVHCPFGGIGFFLANPFPLLWVSEVVLAGSGLELSLSSSMGLGGRHQRLHGSYNLASHYAVYENV